jgi:hypothetical protein
MNEVSPDSVWRGARSISSGLKAENAERDAQIAALAAASLCWLRRASAAARLLVPVMRWRAMS